MKKILVLRHAESDLGAASDRDHERPLSARGRAAAPLIGRFLTTLGEVPDLALCSSAVRARTTVEFAAEAGGWSCPLRFSHELYGAGPGDVVEVVARQQDDADRVLVGGHQPTLAQLIELLCGATVRFPPAALARLDLDAEHWRQARPGCGALRWLVTPMLLERAGF